MTNEEINKLLWKEKWHDHYLAKLAIFDHIRECLEKDNYLKAKDIPKTDVGYENLDKELMDLKLILDWYFIDSQDLYTKRLNKFLENMNKK